MAPRRTKRPGQGFSLFDLQEDISNVVDTLGDALSRQGVPVDRDSLLLQVQNVVQNAGNAAMNMPNTAGYGYPSLASDNEVPYSVAGDLLCIAHEYFQNGDKIDAVKTMLTAMGSDDFAQIANGLLEMNKLSEKTNRQIFSSDTDEDEDEDETDTASVEDDNTSEENTDDTDDDSDLSDEDMQDLIDESEQETTADEGDEDTTNNGAETQPKPNDTSSAKDDEETEEEEDTGNSDVPMGKTSSTLQASMSPTSRAMANKLSQNGDTLGRTRAKDFMKRHNRL